MNQQQRQELKRKVAQLESARLAGEPWSPPHAPVDPATSFAYSARIQGHEAEDPAEPEPPSDEVYLMVLRGSIWTWTPAHLEGGRISAGKNRVRVTHGTETIHSVVEPELVKSPGGMYAPTKGELKAVLALIQSEKVERCSTPRGAEIYEETVANLEAQIKTALEG